MNTDASVLMCRLQDPMVPTSEMTLRHLVFQRPISRENGAPTLRSTLAAPQLHEILQCSRLGLALFVSVWIRQQPVHLLHVELPLIQCFIYTQEFPEEVLQRRLLALRQGDLKSQWHVIKDVLTLMLELHLEVVEEFVLASELPVALKMIDQV